MIFTDVDLGPGACGLWLAFRVRDGWPPVGIIVTSDRRHVGQATIPEGAVFLGKPYLEEQVLDEVRRFA